MADLLRPSLAERDIDQAITALKKGAFLLKYGRRGKPKFCPFRLSSDESILIWYYGKEEKQLELRQVSRIIPGQRTAVFQRYPRPEKEYQSFSLIYSDRSLDVICKDKDEAEIWFVGLKALIAQGSYRKARNEAKAETSSCDSPRARKAFPSSLPFDQGDTPRAESNPQSRLGKAFADIVSYTATSKNPLLAEALTISVGSPLHGPIDILNGQSAADTNRVSLSSAVSSSSQGSCQEDLECLSDVFIWGEGTGEGVLGGGELQVGASSGSEINANLPKALESTTVLDVQSVACGNKYAVLVTKQGEVLSWGEEKGGRLGHGLEFDISNPKLIGALSGMNIEMVACGEHHACAVTLSGDLYSWGDGTYNCGLLGHGSEASHWIPKKVSGFIEGCQVSYVSCGPWHTAMITSPGQLFTFGDGTFGALGHGDRVGTIVPREVESLKGLRTVRVACGVWHTAAIVEISAASNSGPSDGSLSGNLFTWGNGDDGQLGDSDKQCRLVPQNVAALDGLCFSRVACGQNLTVALTTTGKVYTMGSIVHGQLGIPSTDGKTPACVKGRIADSFIEEISCGSHHVAVLTSKNEVYTWGKGSKGQLGDGQNNDRAAPVVVNFLKDKQVRTVACGSNFTAVICLHKRMSSADNSVCSSCRNPFNFRRKRHNCYNCGLVFCKVCSSRKSMRASLAPSMNKPYRVCDECYTKLQKSLTPRSAPRIPNVKSATMLSKFDLAEKETGGPRLPESKLLHSDSFNLSEMGGIKSVSSVASSASNVFLFQNGDDQRVSISYKSQKGSTGASKALSFSLPTSRMVSRSTSPVQVKTRPLHTATPTPTPDVHKDESSVGESKQENAVLIEEIKCLKAQVEEFASKSQLLEAELELKSRQLKEAAAQAADEAEKSRAAEEAIKLLTAQLKEMAERVPVPESPSTICTDFNSYVEQTSNDPNTSSSGTNVTRVAPVNIESRASLNGPASSNAVKAQLQKPERVIQDEPGVYISLCSTPGGGNELRRVRFSRKHFSEEQAEKWWAENGTKVLERHNIRIPT